MDPEDLESCSTAWTDRQYEFGILHKDCVLDANSFRLCLPSEVPRAYTMFLSVVECPLAGHLVEIVPVASLWFESPYLAGVPVAEPVEGQRLRALFRTDHSNWLDPFLVDVTVCSVDPGHRLSECASNEQNDGCPFRGCHGWSPHDTPILSTQKYMVGSEWTAEAGLDNVVFCRDKSKYDEGGCAAGACVWGNFTGQDMAVLGGRDGFDFFVLESEGSLIVVDVSARLEMCQTYENANNGTDISDRSRRSDRRLESENTNNRFIASLRVVR